MKEWLIDVPGSKKYSKKEKNLVVFTYPSKN